MAGQVFSRDYGLEVRNTNKIIHSLSRLSRLKKRTEFTDRLLVITYSYPSNCLTFWALVQSLLTMFFSKNSRIQWKTKLHPKVKGRVVSILQKRTEKSVPDGGLLYQDVLTKQDSAPTWWYEMYSSHILLTFPYATRAGFGDSWIVMRKIHLTWKPIQNVSCSEYKILLLVTNACAHASHSHVRY